MSSRRGRRIQRKRTISKASIKKIVVDYCHKRDWHVADGETYNSYAGSYKDLFGFGDLLVIDDIEKDGSMLIQFTTETHAKNHLGDVIGDIHKRVYAMEWLEKKNRIWFFFFKKKGDEWVYRIHKMTLKDFEFTPRD